MRISYICVDPGVPVFGSKGASVHVQEVVRALRRAGHEVVVHATRRGNLVPADLADLEVIEVPVRVGDPARREREQAGVSRRIAHDVLAGGTDLVYERYSLFSTALATITRSCKARGVLEVNAPLVDEQREHRVLVNERAALRALRAQAGCAHLTVCVSDPVRRWVERLVPGARALTVPNGVSLERIGPFPEDPCGVVVTFVGTLKPWHGVDDLLRAAALARVPWRVRVIGDGPQTPALRALADDLGLDVDFRGAVPPEDVPAHLAGSAVAVAPYPDLGGADEQYFSPLKVLEYLAAGLPVVASAVGQLPRMLQGVGVLVPPSAPARLAGAIDALAADADERARLGALGRRLAEERHGWERVVATVLDRARQDAGASS